MLVTLMAAVAVVDALSASAGFTPTIKWPNDLVVERGRTPASDRWERRKLGGILAEGALSHGVLEQVVVGIGINVAPGAYPPEVTGMATCVEAETGRPVDAFEVFAACRASLARERARLFAGGGGDLLRRWRLHAPSAEGARVAWREGARRHTGLTAGLSATGALIVVDDEGGERRHLVAGEVEWA
jgi:BirA family biotin operon repressor/biotin-[acetyl-CoA-carboxylase] ligase